MDKRVQVMLITTVLLSGGARYLYSTGGVAHYHHQQDEMQVAQRRNVLEQCLFAAQMMYDVQWAAACATQIGTDDSAECQLPDAKAAAVNGWLNEEERRCMAEARTPP